MKQYCECWSNWGVALILEDNERQVDTLLQKKHSAEQTDIKIFIYLLDCIFYPFRTFYAYLQNKIIIKIAYQMEMHFKYEVIISLSFSLICNKIVS